mmetsp:Transcript_5298/g.10207  ORF Transcript_5298/g.10207 Transcript_5298/m.10207 type:complete len:210 (-) Transcript_5298:73-702(-)
MGRVESYIASGSFSRGEVFQWVRLVACAPLLYCGLWVYRAHFFCRNISTFDVRNVVDFSWMLYNASSFDGSLADWDMSMANTTRLMFYQTNFNSDLSKWNVSRVTEMWSMFFGSSFNQDISMWDVRNVENMRLMFSESDFNQDISSWNITSALDLNSMFKDAGNFSQDLCAWGEDIGGAVDTFGMFGGTSCPNTLSPTGPSTGPFCFTC